jgi:hypothetical protein
MSATNPNQETDSFRITQNADGSYIAEWDKEDPNWKWLNGLTSKELQVIIEQAIKEAHDGRL